MPNKKSQSIDFETSLAELNTLVDQMERGDLTLEQSLQKFERGVALTRECQTALKNAEQTVKILTEQNTQANLDDYPNE